MNASRSWLLLGAFLRYTLTGCRSILNSSYGGLDPVPEVASIPDQLVFVTWVSREWINPPHRHLGVRPRLKSGTGPRMGSEDAKQATGNVTMFLFPW